MFQGLKIAFKQQKKLLVIFFFAIFLPSVSLSIFGIIALRNEKFRLAKQIDNEKLQFASDIKGKIETKLLEIEKRLENLAVNPSFRQKNFPVVKDLITSLFEKDSLAGTIFPTAGGSPREILRLKVPESIRSGWKGSVEWIADGRQILFVKAQKDGSNELWQIPVEGGQPQNLGINNQGIIAGLCVHPDGRRIAFTNARLGGDVWVIENFVPKTEAKK